MTTNNIALLASLDETQKTTTDDEIGHRLHLTEAGGQGAQPTTPTPNDSLGEIGEGQNVAEQDLRPETQRGEQTLQRTTLETYEAPRENIQDDASTQEPREDRTDEPTQRPDETQQPQDDQATQSSQTKKKRRKRNKKRKGKKNTRASIKIATLNINGRGSLNVASQQNKWLHINQLMRNERIGILMIQEAHLTEEFAATLNSIFQKRLHIIWSQGNNANAGGVAFVINKEISVTEGVEMTEIIPGRAAQLTTPWHADLKLNIMNIYAPNNERESEIFWDEIGTKHKTLDIPKPDIMLGDFNITEESFDRIPSRMEDFQAVAALKNLRRSFNLEDQWRAENGDEKIFTHIHNLADGKSSHSRLDRIYATEKIIETASDGEIKRTAIPTDHKMVALKIVDSKAPFIGEGRWSLPQALLNSKEFMKDTYTRGIEAINKINGIEERNETHNAQTIFKEYKDDLMTNARKIAKKEIPKLDRLERALKQDLKESLQEANKEEKAIIENAGILEMKIAQVAETKHKSNRQTVRVNDRKFGEKVNKWWTRTNKAKRPRDVIYSLKRPNTEPPVFETNTMKMAQIARDHHHALLQEGIDDEAHPRDEITEEILNQTGENQKLPSKEKGDLARKVRYEEVEQALRDSQNDKAAGINGITYELWKLINETYIRQTKMNPTVQAFDVIKLLTMVYNDIETHGIVDGTDFATGWMCPLYKKKDKREIANYRPITLLNTDYKIFTKVIATRLGKIIHKVIDKAQAGFIPGRNIADQIRLTELMLRYSEANEENGMIIALDQEKAYDKIRHDYLWKAMRNFNMPENLIKTVQSLYHNAQTKIMVNGTLSEPFQVDRGVRQGDPMSCLLFDIAIEPLAITMRKSADLQGFEIEGLDEKIIATYFADDTTVYLSEWDDFKDLEKLLSNWCIASGAKFNEGKTEIIPCGSIEYRENLIKTRKYNEKNEPLDPQIHIAEEKEAVRLLGGWLGNQLDEISVWAKALDKITKTLTNWGKGHPTMNGRRHIIHMTVGGISQFLDTVQGMPKEVEEELERIIKNFAWDGAKGAVKFDILCKPTAAGGLNFLDIAARTEAINIMWAKRYLALGDDRPTWAFVADWLIKESIPTSKSAIDEELTMNTFLQTWNPAMHAATKLPKSLQTTIKTAKKYNTDVEAIRVSENAKMQMPAWYHIRAKAPKRGTNRKKTITCVKKTHKAKTVADLMAITERLRDVSRTHRHSKISTCACKYCKRDKLLGCKQPWKCCEEAQVMINDIDRKWRPLDIPREDNLTLTKTRIEHNGIARAEKEYITFNPSIKRDDNLAHTIRVFTDPEAKCKDPAYRRQRPNVPLDPEVEVYTDGSCLFSGTENARTGSGMWYGNNDQRNKALRVPGSVQSNQVGELVAVMQTVQDTSPYAPLKITTDSEYVINGLTQYLQSWEERGWIGVSNSLFWRILVAELRKRGAPFQIRWIKGHSGNEGNEGADKLAGEGAMKDAFDVLDLRIEETFNLTGAQLSKMTQSRAYTAIREAKELKCTERRATSERLAMTQGAAEEIWGQEPDEETIFKAVHHEDLGRSIRNFLWKMLHKAQKIGKYWEKMGEKFANWGECKVCGDHTTECMTHILLECDAPEGKIIWGMAKKLWRKKSKRDWPELKNAGSIIACTVPNFRTEDGKIKSGENRFYKILISESAHLIWRMRNERVFRKPEEEETLITEAEIQNRWIRTINARLEMDIALTHKRFDKHGAMPRKRVLQTWRGVLENEKDLPSDWIRSPGVLVDMRTIERRSSRNRNRNAEPP